MANVRKLMRMAREFEADEGRDLRGFIDTLAERDEVQSREGEAPLEAEALDAVRLMTVHRAKGLEFPVVCVADLGKDGREDYGRAAHLRRRDDRPAAGVARRRRRSTAPGWPRSRQREKAARRAGGAAHLLRGGHARAGAPRAERGDRSREAPRARGHEGADALADARVPGGAACSVDRAHAGQRRRAAAARGPRCPSAPSRSRAAATPSPSWGSARCRRRARCRSAGSPTAGSRTTAAAPTASTSRRRCACRAWSRRSPAGQLPEAGLGALLRGTLVHELLERLDFGRPAVPSEAEVAALIEAHGATVRPEEVADLRDMVERFVGSELRERIAAGHARAHRAALRLHARAPGRGRAQPARQRGRGRARHRARRAARRRLQEQRAGGPRRRPS